MTDPGRATVAARVPRGTLQRLDAYVALLREAAATQNLVAPSTLPELWTRHILDSLQLLDVAAAPGRWIDVGSGAGLPGLIVACASDRPVLLIEPRRLRAAFLDHVVARLGLNARVEVRAARCETVDQGAPAAVISARAVAALPALLGMAEHLAGPATEWLLPKGRSAADEVAEAQRSWQGEFALVPSITDPAAMIVHARRVRRRAQT